jgi:hypothetical protein
MRAMPQPFIAAMIDASFELRIDALGDREAGRAAAIAAPSLSAGASATSPVSVA